MGLFYRASEKELLESRNRIFVEMGIPALQEKGFRRSPFSTSAYGRNHLKDFSYEFCRLTERSSLEIIAIYLSRRDRWIKIDLNIFQLSPELPSLDRLGGLNGLQFGQPPDSLTKMRLRDDDYKGSPLFTALFRREHRLGRYYSKGGLQRGLKALGELIERDMTNIDRFIRRWHELHKPLVVTWEGHPVAPADAS
ncbi:MAG TPA: hypothetical protein VKQ52_00065 [Puia sp.]|nr:hypothetical protein [Puia sp.]